VPSWKATLWVALEELRASFRDRQTLLYAVVLPICLYPTLFWVMLQGALVVEGRRQRTEVRVGLAAEHPEQVPQTLPAALEQSAGPARQGADATLGGVVLEQDRTPRDEAAARAWLARDGAAPDAVLWIPDREGPAAAAAPARLLFDSSRARSKLARDRVTDRLERYVSESRDEAVVALGGSAADLVPFDVQRANVAPRRDQVAYLLSYVLPMLLVVMCVMGAFFPAVDVTAGEKERSTAETTLLLPVPRRAVHQGKILAVCAASVLATLLNLGALGLSAEHLLGMLSSELGMGTAGIPMLALLAALPLALLFAFFVSAVLVGVASMASSFKEGQALLGPVQMVFLLPATAAMLPGLTLDLRWAAVPVVNVVLAYRSMLQGQVLPAEYTLTALSLTLYSALAIRLAVRMLSREDALLPGPGPSLSRLLDLLRPSTHGR
jgi:ABC-type Na+ efflux pump permease subunit